MRHFLYSVSRGGSAKKSSQRTVVREKESALSQTSPWSFPPAQMHGFLVARAAANLLATATDNWSGSISRTNSATAHHRQTVWESLDFRPQKWYTYEFRNPRAPTQAAKRRSMA